MKVKIKEVAMAKKGWSLYELCRQANVNYQTLYGWENWKKQLHWATIIDTVCTVLDCEIGDLFEAEKVDIKKEPTLKEVSEEELLELIKAGKTIKVQVD